MAIFLPDAASGQPYNDPPRSGQEQKKSRIDLYGLCRPHGVAQAPY
jgi:hypothetical protein